MLSYLFLEVNVYLHFILLIANPLDYKNYAVSVISELQCVDTKHEQRIVTTFSDQYNGDSGDNNISSIFVNQNDSILTGFLLTNILRLPMNGKSTLVEINVWRWTVDRPLSNPIMA